jgi:VWFA-related protein
LIGIAAVALQVFPARGAFAQDVRERVTVDAVQIRVTASDSSGNPVRDLSAADLTLEVDGQPVPIDSIALEGAAVAASPEGPAGTRLAVSGGTAEPPLSAFAIVVDESTTAMRKQAFRGLVEFLDGDYPFERTYLVCTYRRGSLRVDQPWTTNSGTTRATLKRLRDHPTIDFNPDGFLTSRTSLLEFQMMRSRLLTALMQVMAMFPDGPARRQLVLVTGGKTLASPLDVYDTLVEGDSEPKVIGGSRSDGTVPDPMAMDTLVEPFRDGFELWSRAVGGVAARAGNGDLLAKAMERDVALIPVAASTLGNPGYVDPGRKMLNSSGNRSTSLSAQLSANQALWGLARETGSGSVLLAGEAGRMLAELGHRAAYLMSFRYRPPEAGRLHKVELATRRPGISLDYRRGFRIRSAEERVLDSVVAHLALPPVTPDPLSLVASVSASKTEGGPRATMTLRYVPPAPGLSRRPVELIAVGKAADGSWTTPVRWRGEAVSVRSDVSEVRVEMAVEPNAFLWSIGLRDLLTSVDGYALVSSKKR